MLDATATPAPNTMKPTAAEVIATVATWSDLAPSRRRDLTSLLNRAAKLVSLPSTSFVLTPAVLRANLLNRSASTFGLDEGTMRNIVSALRIVLRRVGVIDRADTPLTPAWVALLAALADKKRAGLIAFARYCSANVIEPTEVEDAVLEAFQLWLEERTITARPAKAAGAVRAAWNMAAGSIANWPQVKLRTSAQRRQYILPLDAFPPSFQEDLQQFCDRLGGQSMDAMFDDDEPAEKGAIPIRSRFSRPISVKMRADHCRWAASAFVAAGMATKDDVTSLTKLVSSEEAVRRTLWFLYQRVGKRQSAAGGHVADVLRMIARHHAKLPPEFIRKISDVRNKIGLKYHGMTEKNRRQIRLMMDPAHEALLLQLPAAFMETARTLRRKNKPKQAASVAFRAVAIDLLTVCPVRLSNLIGIQLDRHLRRANPPRGPVTDLYFPADEVKNHRVLDMPILESTAALIEEWIQDFRPAIAGPGCTYLFPGRGSGSITPQGMRDAIREATDEYVGVALTPHQFRHLAAHVHLDVNPGHFAEVSRILGNTDQVAYKTYCGLETAASVNRYGALITQRRKALRGSRGRGPAEPGKPARLVPPTNAAKPKKPATLRPGSPRKPTKPNGGE